MRIEIQVKNAFQKNVHFQAIDKYLYTNANQPEL